MVPAGWKELCLMSNYVLCLCQMNLKVGKPTYAKIHFSDDKITLVLEYDLVIWEINFGINIHTASLDSSSTDTSKYPLISKRLCLHITYF